MGVVLLWCGQGESNSRLVLGKHPLYHLTMAAYAILLLQFFCRQLNPPKELFLQKSTADYSISDTKMQCTLLGSSLDNLIFVKLRGGETGFLAPMLHAGDFI